MDFVVIVEPYSHQVQGGLGIWKNGVPRVIALQCFDEGFGDAIALGRTNWREGKPEPKGCCGYGGFLGDVGAAIVGQPFDGMRRLGSAKAPFHGFDHQVAHHFARYASMSDGRPSDDLTVAGVDDEQNPDDVTVAAFKFKMV